MKRHKHLFDQVPAYENLLDAFYKARKGKRNKLDAHQFEAHLEDNLFQLQRELTTGSYQPGPYHTFKIYDPKERLISAAPFRDRVVHHAVCKVVMPLFERSFIPDTYANRKGYGTHAAIRRCQQYMRQYKYVLKCDIKKYFPSIDHEILKGQLRRKIGCSRTLALLDRIIDNSNPQEEHLAYFPGDDLFTPHERRRGLPIGNLTSQYFANIYLNGFDHFVKEKLRMKGYVRYVDDFVVFSDSKKALHYALEKMEVFLATLRLKVHERKCFVQPTRLGIGFLGQRVFPTHRLLQPANVRRFRRRLGNNLALLRSGAMTLENVESRLNSWLGHARQADTWRLVQKIHWSARAKGWDLVWSLTGSWVVLATFGSAVVPHSKLSTGPYK